MAYHRNPRKIGALGTIADIGETIITGAAVLRDPYFNEAVCHVSQLKAITAGLPVPTCTRTAPDLAGGVGLRRAMPALRGYVYAEQHPWVYTAGAVTAIGIPMLIGYLIGKAL